MTTTQALERLRQVLRRQHKALATEDCYTFWIRRYILALRGMPRDLPSEKKLERFLTPLALRDKVAASTQNQAFNSVVFFYKTSSANPLGRSTPYRPSAPPMNVTRCQGRQRPSRPTASVLDSGN